MTNTISNQARPWHRPGAKALIVHEGKVLLVRERLKNGYILTDFPGGGIEFGEQLQDALQREVFEEIGLQVIPERVVGAWSFVLREPEVHIVCIGYQCRLADPVQGMPVLDFAHNPAEEHIFEAVWMKPEEIIADSDLLRSAEMVDAVKNLALVKKHTGTYVS